MLEEHIIQAGALAAATEKQAYERMKEKIGDIHQHPGLLTVKPAFPSCVDENLLKLHDLISPQDYLPTEKPRLKAPAAIKQNPARPTISYTMHMSREPRDDGCTVIPSSGKPVTEMKESELSMTFDSSSDKATRRNSLRETPNQTKPRPKWKDEKGAKDQTEGLENLQRPKNRHSVPHNPRFLPTNAQQGGSSLMSCPRKKAAQESKKMEEQSSTEDTVPVFLPKPSVVVFTDYSVGQVYETTLELKNVTSSSRHVRVIPPTTPFFSIGLGRFPGEGGVVAPGMSCKYTVRFAPDSLADCEDFIMVETQVEHLFVVPILATRPPPVLTLPRILDCGYCLIGGVKFVEVHCKNVGLSAGTFCVIPKRQWPPADLRSSSRAYFCEQPPFAVSPSLFVLQPGEGVVMEVVFFPTTAEKSCQVFTVVCDNCHVKDISVEGEGQPIAIELVSVSGEREPPTVGEVHDLTAEHFVSFGPSNPHSVQHKKLIVRNNVHLELPFCWQIMKPNLQPRLPGETIETFHIQSSLATDDIFHVRPLTGLLGPCQDHEFLVTFCPKELKDYHNVCHLVLRDVPQLPQEPSENSVLQPVRTGSKVSDVIVMEIEVKGSTEPYQVLLEPYAVVIPGEIFISTTTRRQFKMWNHSKTFIFFQWERMNSCSHSIEVEPSTGKIDENECCEFDLIVTGEKAERVVTSLVCHIEHHRPIVLAVEVSFKGPVVTPSVPSVDFGLMRLGEQTQTKLLLTNTTQLKASWTMEEKLAFQHDHEVTHILVEPCRGELPPFASCSVDLLFKPRRCQQLETELELKVENGTGCHLSVHADVQSPQVCLLKCQLLLSDLYVGVPARGTVTLFNQTLLPSHFTWMPQLQGKQASLCAASFDPSSGTLGPNASIEVTVNFTCHTDLEVPEVAAVCEIQGMDLPLVLGILASKPKALSVVYSLPSVSPALDSDTCATLVLNFGDDVVLKRAVTKQLLITNQTAVSAPFTIEAEYFTGHPLQSSHQSEKRFKYVMKPLHSVQAKKLEEKAHEDFVSNLLAHGKGAAFFVQPHTGQLGPFETQTLDVTAYTDMWGEYNDLLICKVGDLEPTLIPMQMTVKGCPLYFQMIGPQPDNQNQGPTIQFGTHVSGGDTVSRSLRINNPTMLDICMDWETYNIDPDVVAYGEADINEVTNRTLPLPDGNIQTAWERNQSPGSEGASSSLQSMIDGEDGDHVSEEGSEKEQTSPDPFAAEKNLSSASSRPHVGKLSDYPYCITPLQIVIPAKSSVTIHVSFTPLTLPGSTPKTRCVGLALGFLSLESESAALVPGKVRRAQGLDLEPVRVDLVATVKPAVLFVQMKEDDGALEFHASAGDLLRGKSAKEVVVKDFDVTETFQLNNTSEMPLHLRLGAQPPFTVLKPQPRAQTRPSSNSPTGDSQPLVLQPQHNMQVKVAFHCSLSLLEHVDQTDDKAALGVTLIHSANGQKTLRFQQNLLIHYSNNSLQTVPLRAYLGLATLCLSSDSVDFGFCYVGRTRTAEVNLSSHGSHTYWKSVIEADEGDSRVFRVTPDSGLLRFKELGVSSCSECLQIRFTPSEDRGFRATLVIQSLLEKTPITLHLQGKGSFDEVYMSNHES
ncbi:deleted in lung and esophageal cancer protein 1 isoform X2 [Betta splendens]|nr:deleted in lung and esophageal cancer protein 1 isoform X2 [Betta splendens]XP_055364190.1 deleted in lung and esophageal cancer protein 1 isoform X2 [Betta splendens]